MGAVDPIASRLETCPIRTGQLSVGTHLFQIVFCTQCGSPIAEGSQFCTRCGNPTGPVLPSAPLPGTPQAMPVPLTSVSHLVMLWDKLAMHPGFRIQDPSGRPLGETSGGILGLSNELTVFNTDRRVVLGLTVAIEHRLPFGFLITTLRVRCSLPCDRRPASALRSSGLDRCRRSHVAHHQKFMAPL